MRKGVVAENGTAGINQDERRGDPPLRVPASLMLKVIIEFCPRIPTQIQILDTPGILTANSGAPLTVRTGVDCSLNGQGLDTADVAGDWHINQSLPRGQEILKWCN